VTSPSARRVRVVSLVPSVTETLLAWGVEPLACTRFCEQPSLRHVGGTKDPDIDAIVALTPDVVVMDEEENRREDADALIDAGVHVHATAVRSLADVAPTLVALREALGVWVDLTDLDDLSAPVESPISPAAPRAFVPIWRRPWMTLNADTYGSSLLVAVGIGNVFAGAPDRYPTVTLEDVERHRPDLVLLPSEPYPFGERHVEAMRREVPGADVRLVDGRDLFWWGARTPGALDRLAHIGS
jgi:ABC-type Fe3+-hydroxamate transport system substrate-binding protein